jgi:hypothetical protein
MIARFNTCEAWTCLAHDRGLYGVLTRLKAIGFRPGPMLTTAGLASVPRELYARWDAYFEAYPGAADPSSRRTPAVAELLEFERAGDTE